MPRTVRMFRFTGGRGVRGVFQILRGSILQLFVRESARQAILSSDVGIGQDRSVAGQILLVRSRSDPSVRQRDRVRQGATLLHLRQ